MSKDLWILIQDESIRQDSLSLYIVIPVVTILSAVGWFVIIWPILHALL